MKKKTKMREPIVVERPPNSKLSQLYQTPEFQKEWKKALVEIEEFKKSLKEGKRKPCP